MFSHCQLMLLFSNLQCFNTNHVKVNAFLYFFLFILPSGSYKWYKWDTFIPQAIKSFFGCAFKCALIKIISIKVKAEIFTVMKGLLMPLPSKAKNGYGCLWISRDTTKAQFQAKTSTKRKEKTLRCIIPPPQHEQICLKWIKHLRCLM